MTKVVILNDTRLDFHHGCARVMSVLERGLRAQGMSVTATSPLRHRWWQDRHFLRHLAQADRVVINGEGTLHHGRGAGADLLKVVDHDACRAPVFLANAIYQENPADWSRFLEKFRGIWVRDSRSAAELEAAGVRCDGMLPDLTLCDGAISGFEQRRMGTIVGDSVDTSITAGLRKLSQQMNATFLPSLSHLKRPKGRNPFSRFLRNSYIARFERSAKKEFPQLHLAKTPDEYARYLARAELHVTGRFHGVCFSLLSKTPFVALQSNSWKVEALLSDLGLSASRLIAVADLNEGLSPSDWEYSDVELSNIDAALLAARESAAEMFSKISAG